MDTQNLTTTFSRATNPESLKSPSPGSSETQPSGLIYEMLRKQASGEPLSLNEQEVLSVRANSLRREGLDPSQPTDWEKQHPNGLGTTGSADGLTEENNDKGTERRDIQPARNTLAGRASETGRTVSGRDISGRPNGGVYDSRESTPGRNGRANSEVPNLRILIPNETPRCDGAARVC